MCVNMTQYCHLTLPHPQKRWNDSSILSRDLLWRYNTFFPGKIIKIDTNNTICYKVAIFIVQNWNIARDARCSARYAHWGTWRSCYNCVKRSWGHMRALWHHRVSWRVGQNWIQVLSQHENKIRLQSHIKIRNNWSKHTIFLHWKGVIIVLH